MQSIQEKQAELVEDFSWFEDWQEKYKYIIDLGKEMEAYPEEHRDDAHKVKGCQSQVWLHVEKEDENLKFWGDSDALIVKGLVAMLLGLYSGHSPQEIVDANLDFIDKIGLSTHLSPTRSNGLASMIKQIKLYAVALSGNEGAGRDQ